MKDMLKRLDNILLSDDVVKEFYINYIDPDFKNWLLGILPEVEACKNQKQDNPCIFIIALTISCILCRQ